MKTPQQYIEAYNNHVAPSVSRKEYHQRSIDFLVSTISELQKSHAETVQMANEALDGMMQTTEDLFEQFWKEYPRKVAKPKVRDKFKKIKPDKNLFEQMMRAIQNQKESRQWKEGFIPYPLTWLNQGRWEDELPTCETTITIRHHVL